MKKEKVKQDVTKELLLQDLQRVQEEYEKEFPGQTVTRNYYQDHGKYSQGDYYPHFGIWKNFVNDAHINQETTLSKLEKKVHHLENEKKRLEGDKKRLLKQTINNETFLDEFKEKVGDVPKVNISTKIIKSKGKKVAGLLLSDWHAGETVNPDEVMDINEFNMSILFKRADQVFNSFEKYCTTIGISDAHLYFLGDLLTGTIHAELQRTSDVTVVEALLQLHTYILQRLETLSKSFNSIKCFFLSGNHGRLNMGDGKPFHKGKQELNFEFILAKMIETSINQTNQKKITIIVPPSPFFVDRVNGQGFLLMHGDGLTSGGGGFAGIPYYSLAMSSAKLYGALEQIGADTAAFKHILMGHLHTFADIQLFQQGRLIINGSLIGTNEFSLNKMKSNAAVEQEMIIINDTGNIESIIRLIPNNNGR